MTEPNPNSADCPFEIDRIALVEADYEDLQISFDEARRLFGVEWDFAYACPAKYNFEQFMDTNYYLSHQHVFVENAMQRRRFDETNDITGLEDLMPIDEDP